MVVGVCRITMMVPESHSPKEKRMVLRAIKDRTAQKFNCAIAEVGDQDNWQSAVLGLAVVANDRRFVEGMLEKIVDFIESLALAKMVDDERDFVNYGEGELVSGDEWAHWEPGQPSPGKRR
jgi:uncharacterized protein YlxP (DUF503 family)